MPILLNITSKQNKKSLTVTHFQSHVNNTDYKHLVKFCTKVSYGEGPGVESHIKDLGMLAKVSTKTVKSTNLGMAKIYFVWFFCGRKTVRP